MSTTVKVQIGDDSREFLLFRTNAPKAYDSDGSIELYDGTYYQGGEGEGVGSVRHAVIERYVLLPIGQEEWQRNRNMSGLHTFETEDTILDGPALATYLWRRLYGEQG